MSSSFLIHNTIGRVVDGVIYDALVVGLVENYMFVILQKAQDT
jgi:hypothetical protein